MMEPNGQELSPDTKDFVPRIRTIVNVNLRAVRIEIGPAYLTPEEMREIARRLSHGIPRGQIQTLRLSFLEAARATELLIGP